LQTFRRSHRLFSALFVIGFASPAVLCVEPSARAQVSADPEGQLARQFFDADGKCRALLRGGTLKEAEAACKASLQLAERFTGGRELEQMGAYGSVAQVLLGQKRYREALGYYERALKVVVGRLDDTDAEVGQVY
jgi:tetratricopeptide (TPR) repeat protein